MGTKIKQPTITTLTAEINVIKIGNKQLTKAVFSQIREGYPFCEGNLNVKIWGVVNIDSGYLIFLDKKNNLRKWKINFISNWVLTSIKLSENEELIKKNILKKEISDKEKLIRVLNRISSNCDLDRAGYITKEYWKVLSEFIPKKIMEELKREIENYRISKIKLIEAPQIFIAV